ncbi:hypothetical protein FN846DRAFT_943335 [Sphaerosporella brunnea]|uniref:Uncharacterized protein n=1 Tax=Sphaerosporella brunnea TaxID=1250544 RepID=A0A5J5F0Q5_9PEZI|nr:hypothetical protein FN846DRAFT_943335 [Sphaerosporella brunnea]
MAYQCIGTASIALDPLSCAVRKGKAGSVNEHPHGVQKVLEVLAGRTIVEPSSSASAPFSESHGRSPLIKGYIVAYNPNMEEDDGGLLTGGVQDLQNSWIKNVEKTHGHVDVEDYFEWMKRCVHSGANLNLIPAVVPYSPNNHKIPEKPSTIGSKKCPHLKFLVPPPQSRQIIPLRRETLHDVSRVEGALRTLGVISHCVGVKDSAVRIFERQIKKKLYGVFFLSKELKERPLVTPWVMVYRDKKNRLYAYDEVMGAASVGAWDSRSAEEWAGVFCEEL